MDLALIARLSGRVLLASLALSAIAVVFSYALKGLNIFLSGFVLILHIIGVHTYTKMAFLACLTAFLGIKLYQFAREFLFGHG